MAYFIRLGESGKWPEVCGVRPIYPRGLVCSRRRLSRADTHASTRALERSDKDRRRRRRRGRVARLLLRDGDACAPREMWAMRLRLCGWQTAIAGERLFKIAIVACVYTVLYCNRANKDIVAENFMFALIFHYNIIYGNGNDPNCGVLTRFLNGALINSDSQDFRNVGKSCIQLSL